MTVRIAEPWLPAASRAVMVITLTPACKAIALILHDVVPAATPLPQRSQDQLTCVTLMPSAAVPLTFTVALEVTNAPVDVGEATAITGASEP